MKKEKKKTVRKLSAVKKSQEKKQPQSALYEKLVSKTKPTKVHIVNGDMKAKRKALF